jgi:hypothetical protein
MNTRKQVLSMILCSALPVLAAVPAAQAQSYGQPGYGPRYAADQAEKPARAEAPSVTIHAPQDGAELATGEPVTLKYKVVPGPRGDHVHVYVNGGEVAILRELDGSYVVGPLGPGRHELAIKVVNRAHVPIGVESSVTVDVL